MQDINESQSVSWLSGWFHQLLDRFEQYYDLFVVTVDSLLQFGEFPPQFPPWDVNLPSGRPRVANLEKRTLPADRFDGLHAPKLHFDTLSLYASACASDAQLKLFQYEHSSPPNRTATDSRSRGRK